MSLGIAVWPDFLQCTQVQIACMARHISSRDNNVAVKFLTLEGPQFCTVLKAGVLCYRISKSGVQDKKGVSPQTNGNFDECPVDATIGLV